jgi:hypothetical protein
LRATTVTPLVVVAAPAAAPGATAATAAATATPTATAAVLVLPIGPPPGATPARPARRPPSSPGACGQWPEVVIRTCRADADAPRLDRSVVACGIIDDG